MEKKPFIFVQKLRNIIFMLKKKKTTYMPTIGGVYVPHYSKYSEFSENNSFEIRYSESILNYIFSMDFLK